MSQYDPGRTGANMREVLLNHSTVAPGKFGKLFSRSVDSSVYAHPLYVPNVSLQGNDARVKGVRNLLIIATMNNSVYAFDADDPADEQPLWVRNLGPAPIHDSWIGPTLGILSTPAVDTSSQTLYVAATIGTPLSSSRLHLASIDIRNGRLRSGPFPIPFPASTGTVYSTPGTLQRAGLLINAGSLYVGIANFIPSDPPESQEGFVFRYAVSDLTKPAATFRSTPTGTKGGIWQAGRGLSTDGTAIYASTAAGTYDGQTNFGSSVVKLHPQTLQVLDWFTPSYYAQLYPNIDLSAGGTIVVPGRPLLTAGGKEGVMYLLDRQNLGRLGGALQSFDATAGCSMTDCAQTLSTAFWNHATKPTLFVWDKMDVLRAYTFQTASDRFDIAASSIGPITSGAAAGVSVSSRGSIEGTGIAWGLTTQQQDNGTTGAAVFAAYDATNVARVLWSAAEGEVGLYTKFTAPVVANGRVYVPTHSNQIHAYGPLCGSDVTAMTSISQGNAQVRGQKVTRALTIRNDSGEALNGPVDVVLGGAAAARVLNRSGVTTCAASVSSPYIRVTPLRSWLAPGATTNVTIEISGQEPLNYQPAVVAGSGTR